MVPLWVSELGASMVYHPSSIFLSGVLGKLGGEMGEKMRGKSGEIIYSF